MSKTKVGIVGFGNVGHGVKKALKKNPDMKLTTIFTRRVWQVVEEVLGEKILVANANEIEELNVREIDVAMLCGGSKEDIPVQGPEFARLCNTVDSFDTHADIPRYFREMDIIGKKYGHTSIISAGWDPGIFSLERVLADAFLPGSKTYTFWGKGVSQGHSDAVRRIEGVKDARQYTIPIKTAINRVRSGCRPDFSKREMHKRLVYVVAEKEADIKRIKKEITEMPHYFEGYNTGVVFIPEEEMKREHFTYPHGGFVLTSGLTGNNNKVVTEYRCQQESNPQFTASILVACARAAHRLNMEGHCGAFTLLDFPLRLLSSCSEQKLREKFI